MMHCLKWLVTFLGLVFASSGLAAEGVEVAERLPGNEESWIALAIVLGSIFAAFFLNSEAPSVRVFGTVLAAIGCFTVAGWYFFYIVGTGFLDNPKPSEIPLDAAKPLLIKLQCGFSLLAGLGLLWVAYGQSRATESLSLSNNNEAERYGRVSRVLHWTTAILFIAMIPMGIFATMIPEGTPYRLEYYVVHKTIGVIIFALLLVRLVWNQLSPRPGLDPSLKPVERKLAHGAHLALYFMMFAFPITGFVMTSYFGAPTYLFALEMQPLWQPDEDAIVVWGVLHKYLLPYLLYIVLGAHVLGALKHQLVDQHGLGMKRMVA